MLCVKLPCCVLGCVINITKIELLKIGTSFANSKILVLSYFEKKKRNYHNNLDISHITDNKKFWKTVKPCFSDKLHSNNKIVLTEGEKIISNDVEVAKTMNEFFVTVSDSLGINENSNNENTSVGISDPVEKAVQKFAHHPSILKIKGHYQNAGPFVFKILPLMPLTRRLGI